ncbi:hypothetical protein FOL47_004395 [Perkinsus chesapeaki]|uniref:JmjC domain-containing protein n=1 Tax=Perkinsus chesapeaki TaxID=330153 RepID=A0A7J6MZM2_PERCH|nr:hypothetical protein FOL47_004395 [Perkinsus chesapeaki]
MYTPALDQPALQPFIKARPAGIFHEEAIGWGIRARLIGEHVDIILGRYALGDPRPKLIEWDDEDPRETLSEKEFSEKCRLLPVVTVEVRTCWFLEGKANVRCMKIVAYFDAFQMPNWLCHFDHFTSHFPHILELHTDTLRARLESGSSASLSTVTSKGVGGGPLGSVILTLDEVQEREMPGYVELGGGGGKRVAQGPIKDVLGAAPSHKKTVVYGQCAYERDTVETVANIYPFEICPLHESGQGPSLLVGEAGSYSVIHIDREDNGFATLYCIEGKKTVITFSNDERSKMETFINKAQTGSSRRGIPLTNGQDMVLDTTYFTNWKTMKGLPATFKLMTLHPGDMVIIPPGYWHQIVNDEFSVAMVDVWDRGISHFHDRDNHLFMVQFSDILEGRPSNECTLLTPKEAKGTVAPPEESSPPPKRARRIRR